MNVVSLAPWPAKGIFQTAINASNLKYTLVPVILGKGHGVLEAYIFFFL